LCPPSRDASGGLSIGAVTMANLRMLRPRVPTMDTRRVKPPAKVALPFYSTPEWIALRNQVRAEARGMCQRQDCKRKGYTVDHIVEIRDGGAPLDRSNVELLCQPHHVTKSNAERAKRMAKRYN
jgi:5-methylcytosine-specific restriction protein A